MPTPSPPLFKDSRFWVILSFALGIALGPGAIWNWKASALSNAVSTTELRKAQTEIYQRITALSAEYLAASLAYAKSPADSQVYNRMTALHGQLELEKANFLALEEKLARLEDREPRAIQLEFRLPPPPTGFRPVP